METVRPIIYEESEQDRIVTSMIRKHLAEAKKARSTGKLIFELEVNDGCVTHKWVTTTRFKEKS